MPKTVIRQATFMCPLGVGRLGQPNACRFHRSVDNLPADKKCPVHNLELVRTTEPEDQITMTVMGEEDLEEEIAERHEPSFRALRLAEIEVLIAKIDVDSGFPTLAEREQFRSVHRMKVEEQVAEKKRERAANPSSNTFSFKTLGEVEDYRAKRRKDIALAIAEARKWEHRP